MFTIYALKRIQDNLGDLYMKKKTDLSAGKYIMNSDLFPSEDTLMEKTFFQAYRNWLKLLTFVSEPVVVNGWHIHHECMMMMPISPLFSKHGKVMTETFACPSLNVNSSAYIKGFDRV